MPFSLRVSISEARIAQFSALGIGSRKGLEGSQHLPSCFRSLRRGGALIGNKKQQVEHLIFSRLGIRWLVLVVRGYLSDEDRDSGASIKKAIEAVLSDIELDVQSETAERSRTRG